MKDVLTEFYAILIDLFDSYAFMGSLAASVQGWDHCRLVYDSRL